MQQKDYQPPQLIGLSQAQLNEVAQLHALFRQSRPGGLRAVLTGCDLSGLSLADGDMSHADFTGSSFYAANLSGCRFDCATLYACDFREANLKNASMVRADLRGCYFGGANLVGTNLFEADLRAGAYVTLDRHGDFHAVAPPDKTIAAASSLPGFSGADLTNASLAGAVAVKTDFSDAVMRGCKLVRAHIRGANFTGSNLQGADFAQADTRDACFRGAVIAGAKFEYADLAGADLRDVLSDKPSGRLLSELNTSLAELLRLHMEFIASSGAEGAALDLSDFDLRGAGEFAGACLTMLTAQRTVFYGLDLSHTALQAARCANADFRDCRFDCADLRGIMLAGAVLNGASMRGVNLHSLAIDETRRMPSDLSKASLRHVDLRGADLRGALLVGADLSFANLTDANLTDVDLTGARLSAAKVLPVQLAAACHANAIVGM